MYQVWKMTDGNVKVLKTQGTAKEIASHYKVSLGTIYKSFEQNRPFKKIYYVKQLKDRRVKE